MDCGSSRPARLHSPPPSTEAALGVGAPSGSMEVAAPSQIRWPASASGQSVIASVLCESRWRDLAVLISWRSNCLSCWSTRNRAGSSVHSEALARPETPAGSLVFSTSQPPLVLGQLSARSQRWAPPSALPGQRRLVCNDIALHRRVPIVVGRRRTRALASPNALVLHR